MLTETREENGPEPKGSWEVLAWALREEEACRRVEVLVRVVVLRGDEGRGREEPLGERSVEACSEAAMSERISRSEGSTPELVFFLGGISVTEMGGEKTPTGGGLEGRGSATFDSARVKAESDSASPLLFFSTVAELWVQRSRRTATVKPVAKWPILNEQASPPLSPESQRRSPTSLLQTNLVPP